MRRLYFGDVHYIAQCCRAAIRHLDADFLRDGMWVIRHGEPMKFTFADYIRLRMRRRR